jgi:hypothetical protein
MALWKMSLSQLNSFRATGEPNRSLRSRAQDRGDASASTTAVPGALDNNAAVMHGNGWIGQVAPKRPEISQSAILIRACKPGVANDIGCQDRRQFPGLAHRAPPATEKCLGAIYGNNAVAKMATQFRTPPQGEPKRQYTHN